MLALLKTAACDCPELHSSVLADEFINAVSTSLPWLMLGWPVVVLCDCSLYGTSTSFH